MRGIMRVVAALVVIVCGLGASGRASALECGTGIPIYKVNFGVGVACPWAGSKAAACQGSMVAGCAGDYGNPNYNNFHVVGTEPNCAIARHRISPPGDYTQSAGYGTSIGNIPCEPTSCSGLASDGVGDKFTTSVNPGADGYCNTVSGCAMKVTSSVSADGATVYGVTHTSQSCIDDSVPEPVALNDGETCGGSNPEFCMASSGTNCGYVNDDFVCLPKVGDSKCAVFGDGGRVCGASAPVPPVPDNGTAGVPATPDGELSSTVGGDTTTVNYFNSTTVANSARDPGTSGDNPYEEGDDDVEEEGDGEASGGEGCEAAPSCSGDAILCAVLHQEWLSRCPAEVTDAQVDAQLGDNPVIPSTEHDMSTALSETLVVGSTGECPAPTTITLPGGAEVEITVITWFCALADRIAPLVMIMAYMVAVMIVARGTEG